MNEIALNHLDLKVYTKKLPNGLTIYVVPKKEVNNVYATFSTNYGSSQSEFVPLGQSKMKTVPDGVAHFLEHKCFEQEDGLDPFTVFGKNGSDANAFTSQYKTTYLFSGTEHHKENLNFLLDYVQSPYFTEENVEKEKGIIEQEIKMYNDSPIWCLYEKSLLNGFSVDGVRVPIAGTVKSIREITKDILYECYHTFYHPSNMFVVITGNVDPTEMIQLIEENQKKKSFDPPQPISLKEVKEPETVKQKMETLKMTVSIPKVAHSYKIKLDPKIPTMEYTRYLHTYFNITIGVGSLFYEQMEQEGLLVEPIDIDSIITNDYIYIMLLASTKNPEVLVEKIDREIEKKICLENDLERKKKAMLSAYIKMSEDIFYLNDHLMEQINRYHEICPDLYGEIQGMNSKRMDHILKNVHFTNATTVIVYPKA